MAKTISADNSNKKVVSIRDDVSYMIDGKVFSTWQRGEIVIRYDDGSFDVAPKRIVKTHEMTDA